MCEITSSSLRTDHAPRPAPRSPGRFAFLALAALLLVPAATAAGRGDWWMFHRTALHAGLSPFNAPSAAHKKWSLTAGGAVRSSPAIADDGTVYVGSGDGKLYAVNPADGSTKWTCTTGGAVASSPAIDSDGTVYVGSADGKLYAVNPADGSTKWTFTTGGPVSSSPAIGGDGTIYVGAEDGKLYAIKNTDHTEKWPAVATGDKITASPAIGSDGAIYVGSQDGNFYAIKADGSTKWTAATGGPITSSAAIDAAGIIYVGSADGNLYALKPADGSAQWPAFAAGTAITSSPAIGADGTIYVGCNDMNVYALDSTDGSPKWNFIAQDMIASSPAVDANGFVFVGSDDGKLYALDPADGSRKWSFLTAGAVGSSPAIGSDGTVYVGSDDGKFYAIDQAILAPSKLVFGVEPGNTVAGAAIAPAVTVRVLDINNTLVTSATNAITIAIGNNAGGGTLSGTLTVNAVGGIATFSDLAINRTGTGYSLTAAATGLTGATSTAFNITAGTASKVAFSVEPSTTASGASIAPAVAVQIQDSQGNLVATATATVAITLAANPAGGTLSGTLAVNAVNGVATFSNLQLDKAGSGYSLTAASAGLAAATSATFTITPGAAAKLAFGTQPGATTVSTVIAPAVTVLVQDLAGNTVTAATTAVTLAIGANPSGATPGGTLTVNAVNGVATFNDLTLNKVGNGYTLKATATGLTQATSSLFNIVAGTAGKLAFGTQPSSTTAGATVSPAVTVLVQDGDGNTVTTATDAVTLAIGTNPGGGTLSGTLTVNAVNGVATFSDLKINKAGSGYTLTASADALPGATSNAFNITVGTAAQLAFGTQPSNTASGAAITPAVTVRVLDSQGNLVNSAAPSITLAIGSNPGGGTLSGTLTVTAVGGVATFNGLSIDATGAGYTLRATATGLSAALSANFNITAGTATKLLFGTQPSNTVAGATISPAVTVRVVDALGNTVSTATDAIALGIGSNPGGGTLGGTTTVNAVNGIATFSDLTLNKAGAGYTLQATSGTLTVANSGAFNITAGAATKLLFGTQPSNTASGSSITPAVTVRVVDAQGNLVTSATTSITIALGTNPGGGTLTGTKTVSAVNGVATFSDLKLDKTGTGYVLHATGGGYTADDSATFNITPGAAAALAFVTQPSNTALNTAVTPAVTVQVLDAQGNLVTTDTSAVTLALGANPGGGALSGFLTVNAVAGVATFSTLKIDKAGTGYTLAASDGALAGATSTAFNINAVTATQLIFGTQPATTKATLAISPAVTVRVADADGNTVTSATPSITIALGSNPTGGTLSGTLTATAVNGVATFNNLRVNLSGTYTLAASSTGLTSGESAPYEVTAGTATKLLFGQQPVNTASGAAIAPAVTVRIADSQGNTVTTSTAGVTLSFGSNPAGGTLTGTLTVTAVDGVATFNDLAVVKIGAGYTLRAVSTGLLAAISSPFAITAGEPAKLAFTKSPGNTRAGATITPAVTVAVQDAQGNTVTTATTAITLAIGANPGGGTLAGTVTVNAVNGVATFGDLKINAAGDGYTLQATATGLTTGDSTAFNITPGIATQLLFGQQPTDTAVHAAITPAVTVRVADALGNTVTTDVSTIQVALGTNPGGATLGGTAILDAVNGVATFDTLTLNKLGAGYTLTAVSGGTLATAESDPFAIVPGPPAKLVFGTQPGTTESGVTITPAVTVQVQDAYGNLLTADTTAITLAIGTNPPGNGNLTGTLTVNAVAGVATFNDLAIDTTGAGYTLRATAGTLTAGISNAFDIIAGTAKQLAFGVQPSDAAAGATIAPAVTVRVQDSLGNTVTGDNTTVVTVALDANPGAGTLGGTLTATAVNGVATFATLTVDKVGAGYTLQATTAGLTPAASSAFAIAAGTAARLAFAVEPSDAVAGKAIAPAVKVAIQDAYGNVITGDTSAVTIAIGTNPGSGTLSGTRTANAVNGVATFSNLSINRTGTGYTLAASDGALTGATSAAFTITPGTATKLVVAAQPTNTAAGGVITPAVAIRISDALGNTVTADTSAVTLSFAVNPAGGTLGGTLTVNAVNGVATFSDLTIDKTGTGYKLHAVDGTLTAIDTNAFNVVPATAARLAFGTQPTDTAAGAAIAPAVTVRIEDAAGNLVSTATTAVTLALGGNPAGGALSGTLTVNAVAGVATFSTLKIDKAGTGYTLHATGGTLTATDSTAFAITPGAAAKLAFTQAPGTTVAGATIAPAVTVQVLDAADNVVTSSTAAVTLAIGANPGGSTLGGTLTVNAVNGTATFNDLTLDKVGAGYTLQATATGLTAATCAAFDITPGAAAKLAFGTQPTGASAGAAIAPAVTVRVLDARGNLVATDTSAVTLAIGANPGGGTLGGTLTVNAVNGVATFNDLSIDKIGAGYTLHATDGTLTAADSAAFTISAGMATHLAFGVQPSTAAAGAAIAPAVTVKILDDLGNVVAGDTSAITLAIGTNPGGGTLSGTLTVNAVAGVATFSTLKIDKAGAGYTLHATDGTLATADSDAFTITAGAAKKLVFDVQPVDTAAGAAVTPAVVVKVLDANDNLVTSSVAAVTLALSSNPGGSALGGTLTVNAVNGVATFSDLTLDKTGAGYRLRATATSLTAATSTAFAITPGAAATLVFGVQPANAAAGATLTPAVTVRILDTSGNLVTGSTAAVTLALGANPGGSTLGGTLTVNAVNGVATFSDLTLNKVGTGYTLAATATGLAGAASTAFDIAAGAATKLVFGTQPVNSVAGTTLTPAVTARVLDANDNLVTASTAAITLLISANPVGGTLAGTLTVNAAGGVATFSDLSIDKASPGYQLRVTGAGLASADSDAFAILAGAAAKLTFGTPPSNAIANATIAPPVTVRVEDALGNLVASTASVTLAIGTNPSAGTLAGTKTVSATGGVATFGDLKIDKPGDGYTLTATATGLTGVTSSAFAISSGVPTTLVFGVQPSNTAAGTAMTPAVTVRVEDAQGNLVTASTAAITLALGTNPGGGTLTGTLTANAVNGVATFAGLKLDKAGSGYTLGATAASLAAANSQPFNITPGAATKVVFGTSPSDTAAGATMTPAVTVRVLDANDNLVASTAAVTLAISTNPGGATLGGTLTVNAVNGVATFADLNLNKTGAGYRVRATAAGLTAATSAAFAVTPGAATKLVFGTQPVTTASAATITPAVTVRVLDALDNLVTTSTAPVTLSLGANPAGGTLAGTLKVNAAGGVATFSTLSIAKAGAGYALHAQSGTLGAADSASFDITPAAAAQLVIVTQPTTTTAGTVIAPAVTVQVQDAQGNLVTTAATAIGLSLGANPGGGTLGGTLAVNAVNGIATFSDLTLDKAASGYTLAADAAGLASATSTAFAVTPAAAAQLAFGTQPSATIANAAIAPAVTVTVQDAFGNTVDSAAAVTLSLSANPVGGTLAGTLTANAVNGIATFGTLSIDRASPGYQLRATSTGLVSADSDPFAIVNGSPVALAFVTQPSNAAAGAAIAPAVTVKVLDAAGNVVETATTAITLAIGANPGSSTLAGTLTVNAVNGIATFGDLSLNKAGTKYTLTATAAGLTGATSAAFNITPGAAATLAYSVQPRATVAGVAIAPAVAVKVLDANGNLVTTATNPITVALGANPAGGALAGTLTVNAVAGVATFSNLSIAKAGSGYTLVASAAGLTAATSSAFTITPAAAAQLVFGTQPSDVMTSAAIAPAVTVRVLDALGNLVTTATTPVTVALGANPAGGTLGGTLTVSAVKGVATFSTLTVDTIGAGYTLTAAAAGLTGATSTAFNVTSMPPAKLAFSVQPGATVAGVAIAPTVTVLVQDAAGHTVVSATNAVTLAIGTNPAGGTLSGTLTVNAVNGVATFSNVSINKAGSGYTLKATASGLTQAVSSTFTVAPAAAAALAFGTQPSSAAAGATIAPAVTVRVVDAFGNLVTGATSAVTLSLGNNPGGGSLSGTKTVTAVGGVATFSTLSINKTGSGYTLVASASGLTGAGSTVFSITPGAAAKLAFGTPPSAVAVNAVIAPAVTVRVLDANDNVVTSSTAPITMTLAANPTGATLGGTLTVNAVNGTATFGTLAVDQVGSGYTLRASSGALTASTSPAFSVTPGAPAKLRFVMQPSATRAGAAITPAVTVQVLDAYGNLATTATAVTLALGSNPAGGALAGTLTVNAVNGMATFSDLSIAKVGSGYTLKATATGLTGATSDAFVITLGPAARVVFSTQPGNCTAGSAIAPAVVARITDAAGNPVSTVNTPITIAIGANAGGGTLTGTRTVTPINGVAVFNYLKIDKAGAGYTLTASSSGLATGASTAFTVMAGPAAKLAFGTRPGTSVANVLIAPAVTVRVQDAYGNLVSTAINPVAMALSANPAGGKLLGTTTVSAVNGVATFASLKIDTVGSGYTLTASSTGLASATCAPFAVTAVPPISATLTTDKASPQPPGAAPITLIATVSGGSNLLCQFEVSYLDASNRLRTVIVQSYRSATTCSWTPPLTDTVYTVTLYVKDATSTQYYDVRQSISYTITH